MKHIIDLDSWRRRSNFNYFKSFLCPNISVTSEVECGGAYSRAKERGDSFFLTYLYAVLRAVNEVEEFRYRLDDDNQVVLFDKVDILTPIKVPQTGNFFTVRLAWHEDFETFQTNARRVIADIPADGDPYGAENNTKGDAYYSVVLLSATPDLYFTSVVIAVQEPTRGTHYPLFTAGKAIRREGKLLMPIALSVHHGFVDGAHISDFFARVERYLK